MVFENKRFHKKAKSLKFDLATLSFPRILMLLLFLFRLFLFQRIYSTCQRVDRYFLRLNSRLLRRNYFLQSFNDGIRLVEIINL